MLVEIWKDGKMLPEAQDWPALPEKGVIVNFYGSECVVEKIEWHFGETGKFINATAHLDSVETAGVVNEKSVR